MKGKIGIWLKKPAKKGVSSLKKDIFVFAFFLVLSFIFWYLDSLRKDIELDIRYPVRYINSPNNRIIANVLPSKLTFYLKGPGYSVVKLIISANHFPVVIDFSKSIYRRIRNSDSLEYYIVSSGLIQDFRKQLRSDLQIVSIKPDTIFVVFERKTNSLSPDKTSDGPGGNAPYLTSQRLLYSVLESLNERK